MAPVNHAAKVSAAAQDGKARQHAITPDRTETQRRTTAAACMDAVGATKTLVRRDVALVGADGGEEECTHGEQTLTHGLIIGFYGNP